MKSKLIDFALDTALYSLLYGSAVAIWAVVVILVKFALMYGKVGCV